MRVRVESDASLVVRSAAATMAMPGALGAASHVALDVRVAAGASLRWLPEPLVLVAGCDHRMTTRVRLAPGARLVLRDVVVCGRHGEASGSFRHRLRVDADERPLFRSDLHVGPRWLGADGPAGIASARAVAQTLLVGVESPPSAGVVAGVRTATMALGEGAVLVSELADRAGDLVASRG